MKCFSCGHETFADNQRFCVACASPFISSCSLCNAKIETGNQFCTTCGSDLLVAYFQKESVYGFKPSKGFEATQSIKIPDRKSASNSSPSVSSVRSEPEIDKPSVYLRQPISGDDGLSLTLVQKGVAAVAVAIGIGYFFLSGGEQERKPYEYRSYSVTKPASNSSDHAARTSETPKSVATPSIGKDRSSSLINGSASAFNPLIRQMLDAIEKGDAEQVEQVAQQIQDSNLIKRGDRKNARKANDEGLAAIQKDEFSSAIGILEKAAKLDGSDQEIMNNLGYALYRNGDYASAAKIFQRGLLLNPRRTPSWANYSQVLAKLGEEKFAVEAFLLAINYSKNRDRTIEYIDKFMAQDEDSHTQNVVRILRSRISSQ